MTYCNRCYRDFAATELEDGACLYCREAAGLAAPRGGAVEAARDRAVEARQAVHDAALVSKAAWLSARRVADAFEAKYVAACEAAGVAAEAITIED